MSSRFSPDSELDLSSHRVQSSFLLEFHSSQPASRQWTMLFLPYPLELPTLLKCFFSEITPWEQVLCCPDDLEWNLFFYLRIHNNELVLLLLFQTSQESLSWLLSSISSRGLSLRSAEEFQKFTLCLVLIFSVSPLFVKHSLSSLLVHYTFMVNSFEKNEYWSFSVDIEYRDWDLHQQILSLCKLT